jgi:hypothetical protein
MTDKEAQLKAKLLKMKLAESDYQTRNRLDKAKSPMSKEVPFGKDKRNKNQIRDDVLDKTISEAKGTKIMPKKPTQADRARIITAKAKVNKLKKKTSIPDEIMQEASDAAGLNKNQLPSYIAQEHHHKISFRGHKIGGFKGASLNGQSGKYAKYWLLNAKETNGNGWGIAAHTAKENMKKFIGRPLVVTAQSWHGASEYGDEYEHPYLPTNDINAILNHQEKFRVGSIIDVFEDKHGDWYASIEMLPKFANSRLPPFCSPAIYQLDASEAEGQISKWEALHLAALTENPAYGARIALLKGTCVGTDNECKVQFKSAKQLVAESPCHDGYEMFGTKSKGGRKVPNCIPAKQAQVTCPIQAKKDKVKLKLSKLKKKQKISKVKTKLAEIDDDITRDLSNIVKKHEKINSRKKKIIDTAGTHLKHVDYKRTPQERDDEMKSQEQYISDGTKIYPTPPNKPKDRRRALGISAKLLKARLASLGEQNMTYQESKKVKIHKKKHPEVRKASLASEFAHNDIEGVLRGIHSSPLPPDKREHQSSFLSSTGDYIGGGEDHTETIKSIFKDKEFTPEDKGNDGPVTRFSIEHKLPRVQRRMTRRGGRVSFGIHAPINKTQLRSMQDVEKAGEELAFVVGPDVNGTVGEGYRDLTKALRENKYIG